MFWFLWLFQEIFYCLFCILAIFKEMQAMSMVGWILWRHFFVVRILQGYSMKSYPLVATPSNDHIYDPLCHPPMTSTNLLNMCKSHYFTWSTPGDVPWPEQASKYLKSIVCSIFFQFMRTSLNVKSTKFDFVFRHNICKTVLQFSSLNMWLMVDMKPGFKLIQFNDSDSACNLWFPPIG